jgi:hypothetical protein
VNLRREYRVSAQLIEQDRLKVAAGAGAVAYKGAAVTFGIDSFRQSDDGLLVRAILRAGENYQSLKTYLNNRSFKVLRGQSATGNAAGKICSVHCDDSRREISVVACVDDAGEKLKCAEGLYTTVSFGTDGAQLLDTSAGA